MKLKRPKSPDKKKGLSAASVEVELKLDVDVPDKDVEGAVTTGPDLWDSAPDNDQHSLDVSLPEGDVSLQVEEPALALSAAKPDRPEINLAFLGGAKGAAVNFDADVNVGADDDIDIDRNKISIDTSIPDASGDKEDEITFENFGKLLAEAEQFDQSDSSEESEGDMGEQDLNLDGEVKLQANVPAAAAKTDRKMDLDFDWAQLGLNVSDDEDEIDPSTDVNAKVSLTKSSSKSSLSPSSSSVEENKETKKTKGLLPSLKFPKFTGGKGQQKHQGPKLNAEGDVVGEMPRGMEGKLSPSIKVDVEASPPSGSSPKGGKSPKGRLGLFKKGRGKVDSPQFTQQDASLQTDRVVPGVSASVESTPPRPGSGLHPPSTLSPPGTLDLSGAVATHSMPTTPLPTSPSTPQSDFSVVVAIDFGTTFSGYAYSFTKDPEAVHVMRKCEGGDPGVINMKTLTTLLLTPEGEFHSFGFTARDFYHDMKFTEAQKWLYFDKYKLALQDDKNLNIDTEIEASNGTKVKALTVFQHTFRFLKDRFLEELADLSMDDGAIDEGDIRWVLTVPAIWRQPAKQFMRQAAYKAGIASPSRPTQLMIALEPEAASIFIGKLSMKQLMPERMALRRERWLRGSMSKGHNPDMKVIEDVKQGSRYVVVDCGGGTVDITVHEVEEESGTLKELHKASGGMFGSGNVDEAFISLMVDIFGDDFIQEFKLMRPAGWVDLLIAFEARKRNANPWKANYLNVSLPFSFIDYYKKFTNGNLTVEQTLLEYNSEDVKWSGQAPGMLRFSPKGMLKLFSPTTDQLLEKVDEVLAKPELKGISHLFLAGGFAESPLLQNKIRDKYKDFLKVVIPQEVGLATMKGAVMFGQNPWAVSSRRTRLMYGVGALNKFNSKIHPEEKKIVKDGVEWCRDVFDVFVHADQSISAGEKVTRSYAPASAEQEAIKINIYCSENEDARFITDDQVRQCGTLTIDLRSQNKPATRRRELQLSMHFGETEMRVDALDVTTGKKVEARVDFLNN
uniref:Heat shock protein A12 n=1 Tax=Stichopus japonicus TaxID=307972 RepID=A0A493QRC5_STIJA|nr:heat shock protein A12 [Apostichopus japonicus]